MYMQFLSVAQDGPLPGCDPSLPRVAPAACFRPQGNPADGAYACMHRPQSPGPCVVWLYVYVCGLPGPLLICPKPANGLPSDHGCLLYFCLHQLNSDHPLPPAGPNQAPAPPPPQPIEKAWESGTRLVTESWWIKTPSDPPPCCNPAFLSSPVPNCGVTGGHIQAYGCWEARLPVIMLSEAFPHWPG